MPERCDKCLVSLGAHPVEASRLYAVARISGVVGIIWAVTVGVFIVAGGAKKLTADAYDLLISFTTSYLVVGAIILAGGIIGFLGLALEKRWVSLVSCIVCTCWCALVGGFLLAGNFGVNGNLVSLFALHSMTVYILRFWLLLHEPKPGRALWLQQ